MKSVDSRFKSSEPNQFFFHLNSNILFFFSSLLSEQVKED